MYPDDVQLGQAGPGGSVPTVALPYALMLDFSTANIAAGASADASVKQDADVPFRWDALHACVYTPGDLTPMLAGAAFDRAPQEYEATAPQSLASFRLSMRVGSFDVFPQPMPIDLITGDGARPFFWRSPVVIPRGTTISGKFVNHLGAATVRAVVVLIGARLIPAQRWT